MLKIGSLTLNYPFILAPMAGITDLPFRMICRRYGCELAFIEMISAKALVYKNRKTEKMIATRPEDRPLGIQLIGADLEFILKALDIIRKYEYEIIDFNAACPVTKVTSKGEGAGMMKEPRKLGQLLKAIVAHTDTPVTVKIRAGWDEKSVNARESALYAQDAGIQGLFIHGRTRAQGYSGSVDYDVIREVKEALNIPVVGSGDVFSPLHAKKMFDETGCDCVAIARGALGNPWIFRETAEFLKTGKVPQRPHIHEVADIMAAHLRSIVDYHGPVAAPVVFRKLFVWYTKGFRDVKPLKDRAFRAETEEEMLELIAEFRGNERHCQTAMSVSGNDLLEM
ncbi:MAG: tRNA dihydrouridine synthase DusB [Nitrospira bacterium HGW-Nitrospira-1]|nr:MAG: tRNA dihydrouridine synthase DusB [Nitrospira bacterium HGW-Nitrospira-1]